MKKFIRLKQLIVVFALMLPVTWGGATSIHSIDGYSAIQIKEAHVSGTPRGSTIQASITGHYLTVTYTQGIGTVTMELDKVNGPNIFSFQAVTPDSFGFYLNQTGDYIITFTLANGDEYYGEFTITD